MMEAGAYLPKHISPWLTWMQIVLFAMPILFIKHKPARILIIAQLLNTLVAYLVFVLEGDQVTKLFGLGHFFWILPLWYLARDIKSEKSKVYRYYAGVATITIIISLIFDVRDTALWVMGDRESILTTVPESELLTS